MKGRWLSQIRVLAIIGYVAVGWSAGIVVFAVWLLARLRQLRRLRRALAPTIDCPWCRHAVPQYGPYGCTNCRARTLGWAWRCGACHAWAGHIDCDACHLTISNPLLGSP
jgi:hypothetical protein